MSEGDWRPTAPLENLQLRARVLSRIRAFFSARDVLEVETPALSAAAASDPYIDSFPVDGHGRRLWLHTSPEFPMKRLLAAGSGPIYQIARVFRQDESGRLHNPEFTMLEWYRPGWDHWRLMDEVEALVREVLGASEPLRRLSYGEAFFAALGVDPHRAPLETLRAVAAERGLGEVLEGGAPRESWLDLLMSHQVEPTLRGGVLLYDYPAGQAALARIRPGDPPVAERFELYVDGVELANGFHELTDAREQAARFAADLRHRAASGKPVPPTDTRLLAALEAGMPGSAGVALGVDRLVMIAAGARRIDEVIAFPAVRA